MKPELCRYRVHLAFMEHRTPSASIVSTPASIIIGSVIIAISILLAGGVVEVKGLNGLKKTASASPTTAVAAAASTAPAAAVADDTAPAKVSVDDDAVLGDKNAPITMVEFSDYECPFCKRYFDQTYPQLKKDYIDTGKMKLVFRDLPLTFHENAHVEAEAADCARDQGGDEAFYKYHDIMFKTTTSNGTGLSTEQLPTLAGQVGLNGDQLKTCIDSGKHKAEVDKDLADASAVNANGTPTFFIGKSDPSGTITGSRLVGAQPFSAFKTVINQLAK